jgi:hypothetical protein
MARILKSISFAFSEEMLEKLEERALNLGLGRSAYLRQLVADDILKAGGMEPQGNQSVQERVRNLENEIRFQGSELKSLRGEIDALRDSLGAQPNGSQVLPKPVSKEATDKSAAEQRISSEDPLDHFSPIGKIDITGGDGL